MPRSRSDEPLPPRVTGPDLPRVLEAADTLDHHDDVLGARLAPLHGDVDASFGQIAECAIPDADLGVFTLTSASLRDVLISGIRATRLIAPGSAWRTVTIDGGRLATLELSGAELDSVEFRGLRINYANLALTTLSDVRFVDCRFGSLDLPEASLDRVQFSGCHADEVDSRSLRSKNLDLRGLEAFSFTDPAGLSGATLSPRQIEQHAHAFAAALGIRSVE
ncbi:pentapeptide repeat-containing protein [Microbacterium sp. NPDC076895]|uniref:pentapeptide repeat-containing protein n=1 Tax=Microbacterium sp. NPDC076895 TaxID=3154957 RepID=UPI0034295D61